MKIHSIMTLVAFPLLLAGCGGEEPAPPAGPTSTAGTAAQPASEALKPEPADLAPKDGDTDFASLTEFPGLSFAGIGTIPDEGDPRVVLMDGAPVIKPSGQPSEPYWVARPPAQFEITMPTEKGHLHVDKVTIEDTGDDKAFPLCSVSVKTAEKPDWHPPVGLTARKERTRTLEGLGARHVIGFDGVHATAVRVSFPAGSPKQPDRVYVRDIDVIGRFGD